MKEIYKPIVKKFLGKDVRVVQVGTKEYMVLKDMFDALGRLRNDGQLEGQDTKKVKEFLKGINSESALKKIQITSKGKKQSREIQEQPCLLIEKVSIVLTQFKPSSSKKRTQEENDKILKEWFEFMQWVDNLLQEAKAHEVIIKDKVEQNRISEIITTETDHKMVAVNSMICKMMAELIGVYPDIKKLTKEELKIYQPRVTIDLIEVRQEALKVYQQQLIINDSKSDAYDNTLKYMKRMYKLE